MSDKINASHAPDTYSVEEENEDQRNSLNSPPHQSIGLNVLLVEDDPADAYLIKHALYSNPMVCNVLHVKDGIEALKMLDVGEMHPDLAIVDLHMPRKDGFSLLADFRRENAQFPSIVLTSSKLGADSLRARKRGAEAFITKPNTLAKLTEALDNVICKI
jgi:CheY-like chemotaxis protein